MLTVTAHFRDVGLIGRIDQGNDGHRSEALETGQKVVYIAPMKALAQEVVEKFSSKLKPLGLIVRELTGDMQLTRAEAESANVIGKFVVSFMPSKVCVSLFSLSLCQSQRLKIVQHIPYYFFSLVLSFPFSFLLTPFTKLIFQSNDT